MPAAPPAAATPPTPRYAGFWVRFGAFFLDGLLFQALALAFPIADVAIFEGELGTDNSYEVASSEVVAERDAVRADGTVTTYVRTLEVRIDPKGRSATHEIETTTEQRPGYRRARTVERTIEIDPGWGGKYATHAEIGILIATLAYFVLLWSSRWRNTPGGRILKLRITDYDGNRISRRRALVRVLAGVLSLATGIGVLMIAFTRRKQALHDIIAGTLVIDAHVRPPIPGIDPPGGG